MYTLLTPLQGSATQTKQHLDFVSANLQTPTHTHTHTHTQKPPLEGKEISESVAEGDRREVQEANVTTLYNSKLDPLSLLPGRH